MKEIRNIEEVAEYVKSLRVIIDNEYEKFDSATTYAEELAEVEYDGLSSTDENYLSAVRNVLWLFDELYDTLENFYEQELSISPLSFWGEDYEEGEDC